MDTLFNSIFEPLELEVCSFNYGVTTGIMGYLLVKLLVKFIFETYTRRNTMSINIMSLIFMTIVFVFIFMLPILIIYGLVRMNYQYCKKSSA